MAALRRVTGPPSIGRERSKATIAFDDGRWRATVHVQRRPHSLHAGGTRQPMRLVRSSHAYTRLCDRQTAPGSTYSPTCRPFNAS